MTTFKLIYYAIAAGLSAVISFLMPTFPLIAFAFALWLTDIITAFRLQKYLHKKNLLSNKPKLESLKFRKAITTLNSMLFAIIAAHVLDVQVFHFFNGLHLANWATGICCFVEAYSILENKSSMSDGKIARVLKSIMIDKAAKWIDCDKAKLEKDLSNDQTDSNNVTK